MGAEKHNHARNCVYTLGGLRPTFVFETIDHRYLFWAAGQLDPERMWTPTSMDDGTKDVACPRKVHSETIITLDCHFRMFHDAKLCVSGVHMTCKMAFCSWSEPHASASPAHPMRSRTTVHTPGNIWAFDWTIVGPVLHNVIVSTHEHSRARPTEKWTIIAVFGNHFANFLMYAKSRDAVFSGLSHDLLIWVPFCNWGQTLFSGAHWFGDAQPLPKPHANDLAPPEKNYHHVCHTHAKTLKYFMRKLDKAIEIQLLEWGNYLMEINPIMARPNQTLLSLMPTRIN